MAGSASFRATTAGMRQILYLASGLVMLMGISLFVLSDRTDEFAPWPVRPALTAAFLGSGYWSACALEWLSAREEEWSSARVAVPAVWVFTTLTLVATLVHIDRFHFGSPIPHTAAVAWSWMAVYALVPVGLGVLWWLQSRVTGRDRPAESPFSGRARVVFALQAAALTVFGVALFAFPAQLAQLWPWQLSPLTGRAVGAWFIGGGVLQLSVLVANDWWKVRPAMIYWLLYAMLQSLALARYHDTVDWRGPAAWVYVAFLVVALATGVLGTAAARRGRVAPMREVKGAPG